ncbi:putative endoplasmic reticulum membrane protein [Smittium culicis]|uniref:Putative endoplasmic reticulum membrane protein n=1 Tax=Smittium culicis TaxID=133412 RepID=A0A1R1Y4G5_9FUNG|nr:putative endoplasmic reticulum membrane protein [Smittium culicis]OMJ21654.1 putative endoplasmic reticulum membrane protein [Smittium culicis]
MSVFDLKTQYVKYGEYHSNPVNILFHQIFVPSILWSTIGLLYLAGPMFETPEMIAKLAAPLGINVTMNLGTIMTFVYMAYYLTLDTVAALIFAPFQLAMLVSSTYVMENFNNPTTIMIAVYVTSWVVQVGGHFVFEKRAPALLDNLVQAFAMAPFFVFLELLFMIGYRPEFHKEVHKLIVEKVEIFRSSKANNKKSN